MDKAESEDKVVPRREQKYGDNANLGGLMHDVSCALYRLKVERAHDVSLI